jgi:hypothetical protein
MAGVRCWEFKECAVKEQCPAYPDKGFACWTVEGTLCRGEKQGGYSEKVGACRTLCQYYNGVMAGTVKVT